MRQGFATFLIGVAATLTIVAAAAPRPPVTFALTGDSIITRKLSVYQEPEFTGLIDLVRGADVAFTNLEMLFHDYESYPMNESGGTWMRADPALIKELSWAGFDLVSRANNHSGDYGVGGMRLTTKYVRERSEEHTSELQSRGHLVCRLLLEKKK